VIHRLQVRGYKSLVNASVEFERLAVIVGPNGAGKSNLLDLIHLASRLVSRETVREAFESHRGRPIEAFHSREGFGQAETEQATQRSFHMTIDLELSPSVVESVNAALEAREKLQASEASYTRVTETRLRYSLSVTLHTRTGELLVSDEDLRALKRDWTPKSPETRSPFIEKQTEDGKSRFVARIERQSHPRYFEVQRPRTLLSELSDPVYHPHVVAAAREIASWRVYYVEPGVMRGDLGVQSADEPGRRGEFLPAYYYTLQGKVPSTFRGIVKNLRDLVPGLHDLRVDVRDGLLEIIAIQKAGAEFPARLLSEGTLRLMCILGIAVAPHPPAVVVYEEPENGVNPSRLDVIAEIVRRASVERRDGSQFILTTHSPLLCEILSEYLIACTWDSARGTTFRTLELQQDGLFTQREIARALDDSTASVS
jgi:predicted ATPase